jgi:hypothetical protein
MCEHQGVLKYKISLHVIVKDLIMPPMECKKLQESSFPYCDSGVYNWLQNLRMPNSTKSGVIPRYKKLIYGGPLTLECFVQYKVPKVTTWAELKALMPPPKFKAENIISGDYPELMGTFVSRPDSNVFVRIKPAYCSCCERKHDSENISVRKNSVYCFRSGKSDSYENYVKALLNA